MFVADLHGKLSIKEQIGEDFLTSSVFSVLDYLGGDSLEKFLCKSINLEKENLNIHLQDAVLEYWPWLPNSSKYGGGAEPDVVVFSGNTAIIVEAKNYSGKSGVGVEEQQEDLTQNYLVIKDQLGREYFAARKNYLGQSRRPDCTIEKVVVIYLTRHILLPKDEIKESLNYIRKIESLHGQDSKPEIYWLNWQAAIPILTEIREKSELKTFESKITSDLIEFLEKRDLKANFDFGFLSDYGSITKSHNDVSDAGFLFYPEVINRYWDDVPKVFAGSEGNKIIFYNRIETPYWNLENTAQSFDLTDNIFYKRSV